MVEVNADLSSGAAAKSPLIMGNDIRSIQPSDLSILSNPAIIAINQDPSGSSAARRWFWNINATDSNFISTSRCGLVTSNPPRAARKTTW